VGLQAQPADRGPRGRIEFDHTPRRGWFRAGSEVEVHVTGPVPDQEPVTCIIPGHHRSGEEVYTELRSSAEPLAYAFAGRCGYQASFAYSSATGGVGGCSSAQGALDARWLCRDARGVRASYV